ncbi:hemagglutinin [Caballeronia pedi]|uniref:Hemagglutinin n=1 Tax=Caballeronia pedi TaxID=1777141 RepID=A0A157Z6U3_9BURK|nr:ESPR-type extended signal peptide-containing protein [Caballeronia pedi]SAK41261.1 hemagglutinin [Caballeronia pedi]
MNKSYRVVWSVATGTFVVASELAKGRSKKGKVARLAATIVFGAGGFVIAPAAFAGTIANCNNGNASTSYASTYGTNAGDWALGSNPMGCSSAGANGIIMSESGTSTQSGSNAWMAVGQTSTTGAGTITLYGPNGITLNGPTSLSNNKITSLTAGTVSSGSADAVNGGELYNTASTAASALGTTLGANGAIVAPSYALTNANSIGGTTGAAADVGSAFAKVDTALGEINTQATNTNRYFKAGGANNGTDDASAAAGAVAVGVSAAATGIRATAMGNGASTASSDAIAIGTLANVVGNGTVAIGSHASAFSSGSAAGQSVALGASTSAGGDFSTALGSKANSTGNGSTAVGVNATTIGNRAVAMGASSAGAGSFATAVGTLASAGGNNSAAFGTSANASAANSVALGAGSTTTTVLTQAGYNPGSGTLSGTASTANGEVSLGSAGKERRLTNAAAGSSATDAVNVSQLQSEDAKVNSNGFTTASALGGGAAYNSTTGSITAPSYALTNANSIAGTTGAATDVGGGFGKVDAALGKLNTSVAGNTTAITNITNGTIGLVQQAAAGADLTVGKATDGAAVDFADKNSNTRTLKNVTAGVAGTDAVNMSQLNTTNSNVAQNTTNIAGNTTSINNINTQISSGAIGLVQQDATTRNITVAKNTDGTTVDFTGTPGARVLDGVANGAVTSTSKQAVNGSQLYALAGSTASAMGGGSTVNSEGSITAPTYNIHNADGSTTTVRNVGDAVTNIDARATQNTTDIAGNTTSINNISSQISTGSIGLVQQAAAGADLTVGKATDGAAVDFADKNGNTRTLKNVTAGVAGTDAANMSQLNATNANVAQNTTDIAGNTTSINNISSQISSGTIGLVQQAVAGADLTVGKATDGAAVDFADKNGNTRTLKNVTAGVAGTDAVNMSQLNATNANVAQNTTDIAGNTTLINNINTQISSGAIGLVQQAVAGADLTVGKATDGAAVDFADKNGNTRTLKNVTAGVAGTDAVNMSQLNATNANVAQNTTNIAGNTTSINNLDGRVTQNTTDISSLNTSITSLNGQMSDAVMYDSSAHDKVTLGNAGTPVQLTNVKAGALVANSTDAVNGSQLYATNQQVAQNTTSINNISNQINSGEIGLVQQDATTRNITVAKNTDGTTVDFTGTPGARVLDGVANGAVTSTSKQAVNGSQLYALSASTASAMGGGSTVNSDGSITAPTYNIHNADGSTTTVRNIGDAVTSIDARTTQNTTNITDISNQINSGAIGLVQQNATTRNINVAGNTDGTVVNVTGTAGARVLEGVANGAVTPTSRQAVNGSQLHALASSTASSLGGGSTVNSDGSITAPTYTVNGQTVNNVGAAVTNLDARTTQNTSDIANLHTDVTQNTTEISNLTHNVINNTAQIEKNTSDITNITNQINAAGDGVVQQNQATHNITVAKSADGKVVDITGTQGARSVTGVAAGTLSVDSVDAVNGSQLYQTNQRVSSIANATSTIASNKSDTPAVASGVDSTAQGNGAIAAGANSVALGSGSVANEDNTVSVGSQGNERRITNVAPGVSGTDAANMNQLASVQNSVNSVARAAYSGVAAAMAMPNLTPRDPGKVLVAAGVANYKGYTAMGVGGTYRSENSHWLVNGALSLTPHGDAGVRAQVGYEF